MSFFLLGRGVERCVVGGKPKSIINTEALQICQIGGVSSNAGHLIE